MKYEHCHFCHGLHELPLCHLAFGQDALVHFAQYQFGGGERDYVGDSGRDLVNLQGVQPLGLHRWPRGCLVLLTDYNRLRFVLY